MPSKAMEELIERAVSDEAFAEQLRTDPAGALAGYDLTPPGSIGGSPLQVSGVSTSPPSSSQSGPQQYPGPTSYQPPPHDHGHHKPPK